MNAFLCRLFREIVWVGMVGDNRSGLLKVRHDVEGVPRSTRWLWRSIIEEEEIGDLEKAIRLIKQCRAFYKCLEDRRAGKVKHCYENDKRWRLND